MNSNTVPHSPIQTSLLDMLTESDCTNSYLALRWKKVVDVSQVKEKFIQLTQKLPILLEGQMLPQSANTNLVVRDWQALQPSAQRQRMRSVIEDIKCADSLSLGIAQLNDSEHWLCIGSSILSADMPSLILLVDYLLSDRSELPSWLSDPIHYGEVSEWLTDIQQDDELAEARSYWRTDIFKSNFAVPFGQYKLQTDASWSSVECDLAEYYGAMRAFCAEKKVSMADALCACIRMTLKKLEPELFLARRMNLRRGELSQVIGCMTQVYPLQVNASDDTAQGIRAETEAVNAADEYLECYVGTNATSSKPKLAFSSVTLPNYEYSEITHTNPPVDISSAEFIFIEGESAGKLQLHFSQSELAHEAAEIILESVKNSLNDYFNDVRPLPSVHPDSAGPCQKTDYDNVVDWFQVAVNTSTGAFEDGLGNRVAFADINLRANQLAHWLVEQGIVEQDNVVLMLPRGEAFITAMLAVLKAGATYVPVDTKLPSQRIKHIIKDAKSKLVLTDCDASLPNQQILSDVDLSSQSTDNLQVTITPEHLAYILYTSGTTGTPKGVKVSHRALNNHMAWMLNAFDFNSEDRFLFRTSVGFDASIWEYWAPLLTQAQLTAASDDVTHDLEALANLMSEQNVSIVQMVPSLMDALLMVLKDNVSFNLRHCFLGGEALKTRLAERVKARFDASVTNLYGPSECTIQASHYQYEQGLTCDIVPLGKPISNTEFRVFDEHQQPLDLGREGELCIAGACIFSGYLNQDELTEQSTFVDGQSGKTFYRTGDKVRQLWDGNFAYLGRLDQQVKRNGYRIELNEITALLENAGLVTQAQCTYEAEGNQLNLFVVSQASQEALSSYLLDNLPAYMQPNHIIELDEMPLNRNGKVDLNALAELKKTTQNTAYIAPQTDTEERLAEMWRTALSIEIISADSDFFELGGHSLQAMKLVAQLNRAFGVSLSARELFAHTRLDQLASFIDSQSKTPQVQIAIVDKTKPLPLSFSQQRMWFIEQMGEQNSQYNMPLVFQLEGQLDKSALQASFNLIVERHDILRTIYQPGPNNTGQQLVLPAEPFDIGEFDLSNLEPESQLARIQSMAHEEAKTSFDLTTDRMIRVSLLKSSETSHTLLLTLHHIASDGWSLSLLTQEFTDLYSKIVGRKDRALPALPIQFADFAMWQREQLSGDNLEHLMRYWGTQLDDLPVVHDLPLDFPRPARQSFKGAVVYRRLEKTLSDDIKDFSLNQGATLFMALESAFSILVSRFSNAKDIAIGTPIANRPHADLSSLMGFFLNNLVLRHNVSDNPSYREYLQASKNMILDAYEHQSLPFEMLVDELQPTRTLSHTPLFQLMFTLQNNESAALSLPDLTVSAVDAPHDVSKYDITLSMEESEQGLIANWEFNTDIFTEQSVTRMADSFETLLQNLLADPDKPILDTDLVSHEQLLMLQKFNETALDYDKGVRVESLFEQQTAETPQNTALIYQGETLTYRALNEQTNQLARLLLSQGVKTGDTVAVCQERGLEMVISLFACWKAGAAYLPLDPGYPIDRLQHMLTDSKATLLLTQTDVADVLDVTSEQGVVCVDKKELWQSLEKENLSLELDSQALAYVIYTSGSTGMPKGVTITHQNVTNFFAALDAKLGQPKQATWLASTSISFDISVLELFWTLCNGHQVVVQPERPKLAHDHGDLDFSLFYFAAEEAGPEKDKYELLLEGAKFADKNDLAGVWIPERHFASFGDQFPNPSVAAAAVAAITKNITIHSGSVVLPLHDPIRVAEEWSMVDNLSQGRVQLSMASGWHPNDFVFAPDKYKDRFIAMRDGIEQVQELWQGRSICRKNGVGKDIEVSLHPAPVQPKLPIWITAGGSPDTFKYAGSIGANILTHLLGQDKADLADKITLYRQARQDAGFDPQSGKVALMLHTFMGEDATKVKQIAEQPFKNYLRHSLNLLRPLAQEMDLDFEKDADTLIDIGFQRFYQSSGLFGTPDSCLSMAQEFLSLGVNEIACLIDFGIDHETTLAHLPYIQKLQQKLRQTSAQQRLLSKRLALNWHQAELINKHQISHLQCTPSYAKEMLADRDICASLENVQQFLVGGEALSVELADSLVHAVSGRVFNMYGPTETTVWSGISEVSENTVQLGGPIANTQFYVLSETMKLTPIGVVGELYIGGDGVSPGYFERDELNQTRFLHNPYDPESGKIYKTGDLVSWMPDGSLKYMGREDHQVKLRGFRIELGEIESVLHAHNWVEQVVVTANQQRLVAYLVCNDSAVDTQIESELTAFSAGSLPEFMLPGAYIVLPELPLTPNGKVDRNALPDPSDVQSTFAQYIEPTTEIESQLCERWQTVLGIEQVGIRDNFFKIGGDSILSIRVVAECAKHGLKFTTQQLFEFQTIESLAPQVERVEQRQISQQPSEGVQKLLPIQNWFLDNNDGVERSHYNQSVLMRVPDDMTLPMLTDMFNAIYQRHDALRLAFNQADNRWQVRYLDLNSLSLEACISETVIHKSNDVDTDAIITEQSATLKASLDIEQAKLLAARLFSEPQSQTKTLFITLHHLVVDGISWRALLSDLQTAYQQLKAGQDIVLSDKTTSLQDWAEAMQHYSDSDHVASQKDFWLSQLQIPVPQIDMDNPAVTDNSENTSSSISFALDKNVTQALLTDSGGAYNTEINELLLSALYLGFQQWSGHRTFRIDMEGHGREDVVSQLDVSDTVGWFTSLFPVTLKVDSDNGEISSTIMQVKEQYRQIPDRGLGFGALRHLKHDEDIVCQQQGNESPILFNYLGQFDQQDGQAGFTFLNQETGPNVSLRRQREYQFSCTCVVNDGQLQFTIGYNKKAYQAERIQNLAKNIQAALEDVVSHCNGIEGSRFTPSDFPLIQVSQSRLNNLQLCYPDMLDLYPSSGLQKGLLFHSKMDCSAYVTQLDFVLNGNLDVDAFCHAWQQVIETKDIFRTAFVGDNFEQLLVSKGQFNCNVQDWRKYSEQEQTRQYAAYQKEDKAQGFDVEQPSLVRVALFRLTNETCRFLLTYHHALMDAWSQPVVLNEVMQLYAAKLKGSSLSTETVPYKNYLSWLQQQDQEAAEAYWQMTLGDVSESTHMGLLTNPEHQGCGPGSIECQFSQEQSTRLSELAQQHNVTLNTLFQGAWAYLQRLYSGKKQVVFGETSAGRPADLAQVESIAGLFINTLPVRVDVDDELTLAHWLQALQKQSIERNQYSFVPLTDIHRQSGLNSRTALFDTLIAFNNLPLADALDDNVQGGSLTLSEAGGDEQTNYGLTLSISAGDTMHCSLRYSMHQYDSHTVQSVMDMLNTILIRMLEAERVADLAPELQGDATVEGVNLSGNLADMLKLSPALQKHAKVFVLNAEQRPAYTGQLGQLYISLPKESCVDDTGLDLVEPVPELLQVAAGRLLYKANYIASMDSQGICQLLGEAENLTTQDGLTLSLMQLASWLKDQAKLADVHITQTKCRSGIAIYAVPGTTGPDGNTLIDTLRACLAQRLPANWQPKDCLIVDCIARDDMGRVIEAALPKMPDTVLQSDNVSSTAVQQKLQTIWQELLVVEDLELSSNFYELGGNSLTAVRLEFAIKQAFEIDVTINELFQHATLIEQAALIASKEQSSGSVVIEQVTQEGIDLPLSFAQQRLWFIDQLEPGTDQYNMPMAFRVKGKLDIAAMQKALEQIVDRHQVLRSVYHVADHGSAVQVVQPDIQVPFELHDLRHLPFEDRQKESEIIGRESATKGFDLSNDSMLRVALTQVEDEEYDLVFTMHHIAADGWSIGVLMQEFAAIYNGIQNNSSASLPPLSIQYADFANWQQLPESVAQVNSQLDYWKIQLENLPQIHALPLDKRRPEIQSYRGAELTRTLDKSLTSSLNTLSGQHDATLFMTLQAAFAALLSSYSREADIVVGTPVANRRHQQTENLIGFFVNTLVLRTDLSKDPSFSGLLEQVRKTTLEAFDNQDVPFEMLVETLQPDRNLSHMPLFQVMFSFQNNKIGELSLPDVHLSPVAQPEPVAKFDLSLNVEETENGLHLGWEYCSDLFEASTINAMAIQFEHLLSQIVTESSLSISQLNCLPDSATQRIALLNDTKADYPAAQSVQELFTQYAEITPNKLALVDGECSLSYAQLETQSNQLAHYLQQNGVTKNTLVGVCMQRRYQAIVAILAIIKSGGAYLPIDPEYPQSRIDYMVEDADLTLMLTEKQYINTLDRADLTCLAFDDEIFVQMLETQSANSVVTDTSPDDLLYVIYTSGSTGNPKGVKISHRNILSYSQVIQRDYTITSEDRVMQFSSVSFDIFVEELCSSLLNGGTMILRNDNIMAGGKVFWSFVEHHNISVLCLPTAFWHQLSSDPDLVEAKNTSLRVVTVGGEAMTMHAAKHWRDVVGDQVTTFNTYGPTETTITASIFDIAELGDLHLDVPIGQAIRNTTLHIMDAQGQPVPFGAVGELYVGGNRVGLGYLNQPELTADKFVQNPLDNNETLYRTGDLVRYLADGQIAFMGRVDEQVKVRGYRIELSEIEHHLLSHEQVKQATVTTALSPQGDKQLVAYVSQRAELEDEILSIALKALLQENLPQYMQPAAIMILDALPLTKNGKIDKRALPAADFSQHQRSYVAPKSDIEVALCDMWQHLLGLERVGVDDNFFEIGGHSLLVTRLISEIRQHFDLEIPIKELFSLQTVYQLACYIESETQLNQSLGLGQHDVQDDSAEEWEL